MEQFLDFLFGIAWWQWLGGMTALAALYYVAAAVVFPRFKQVVDAQAEADEQRKKGDAERQKLATREEREAARREYLKKIPSGPVAPANLPPAMVRARGHHVALPRDREFLLGSRRGASLPLVSRGVSRDHAKIRPEARGYVLYDLLSEAGTFVGGERIESRVLADGDRFRIGPVEVLFKHGTPPKEEEGPVWGR